MSCICLNNIIKKKTTTEALSIDLHVGYSHDSGLSVLTHNNDIISNIALIILIKKGIFFIVYIYHVLLIIYI